MAQARYKKEKPNLDTWFQKKRLEERKKPLKKAKPPNLLNITLF